MSIFRVLKVNNVNIPKSQRTLNLGLVFSYKAYQFGWFASRIVHTILALFGKNCGIVHILPLVALYNKKQPIWLFEIIIKTPYFFLFASLTSFLIPQPIGIILKWSPFSKIVLNLGTNKNLIKTFFFSEMLLFD